MPANVETMFSVREKPWHGLGVIIQEAVKSEDALKVAGLDWQVISKDVHINVDGQFIRIPNQIANTRSSDNQVLGIVTDSYKIVQNKDAFAFTDHLLGTDVRYETAGSLAKGRRVWMLAKMPSIYVLNDEVEMYLVFSNAHDGKGAVKVAITPVRVVCQNTLNLALGGAQRMWTAHHTGNIENKLEEARRTLELATQYAANFGTEAGKLVNKVINDAMFEEIMNELLPIREDGGTVHENNIISLRTDLKMRYENAPDIQQFRGTAWGVINAVSDFATHADPNRATTTYKERLFAKTVDGHPIIDSAYKILKAA